ncbi:ydjO [Escherichia coli]|nr:ydjO [Escherichia coli]
MMSLWDALRMNMMISYQELVRTFLSVSDYTDVICFTSFYVVLTYLNSQ